MILVVGDLVTDVLVRHDGPIQPGSDTDARIIVSGGGQAANTAAWLAVAGHPVTLIAAVGDDAAGRARVAELAGVRCAVRVRPDAPTGSVVVLTSAGERTMITDRGAALLLDPSDVEAAIETAPDAAHLHLSGYPLLHPTSRPAGLAALATARARGLTTSVDAASAAPLRVAAGFLDWIEGVDLLLCNADEAAVLAGRDLTAVAANVVIKRGAEGATWYGRTEPPVAFRGPPVPVVDATGAGDAFAAGLLAAWTGGASSSEALAAGAALGAAAVGRVGARPSR